MWFKDPGHEASDPGHGGWPASFLPAFLELFQTVLQPTDESSKAAIQPGHPHHTKTLRIPSLFPTEPLSLGVRTKVSNHPHGTRPSDMRNLLQATVIGCFRSWGATTQSPGDDYGERPPVIHCTASMPSTWKLQLQLHQSSVTEAHHKGCLFHSVYYFHNGRILNFKLWPFAHIQLRN